MSSPFGIYVHWPFCAAKCPYCDFNSHVRSDIDAQAWATATARELAHHAALQGAVRPLVSSIFFGGGTPSLMPGTALGKVLETIARLWPVAPDVEITLEANPASADAARFQDYRAAGVNRLSLGLQALDDAALRFLGRLHTVAEALAALKLAQRLFDRVSIDLIYARVGQSRQAWQDELRRALGFGTEHLSLYQLTIEEATPFARRAARGETLVPPDEQAVALYECTQELTAAAGRPAYEISNHAARGAECRHNLVYWRYGAYVGVGPGAHGRLDTAEGRVATHNEKLPERWLDQVSQRGHGVAASTVLSAQEAAEELLLMGLRLSEGVDLAALAARFHWRADPSRLAALAEAGWVQMQNGRLSVTPPGRLVLNRLISELL
jgi:oxygen-independent coproporphyrinogen-3 oxidase